MIDVYAELAAAVLGKRASAVTKDERTRAKQAYWQTYAGVSALPDNKPVADLVASLGELRQAGALEGISAVIQARVAMVRGQVPVPGGDLVAAAMWHQATEAVRPRLERLALACAILTIELDAEALRHG